MVRRKRVIMDDASDSDEVSDDGDDFNPNESQDVRDERALFRNPYHRSKRRRTDDEDEDDDGFKIPAPRKRSDWTRAPTFTSGKKVEDFMDVDGGGDEGSSSGDSSSGEGGGQEGAVDDSDSSAPSRQPSPRIRDNEDDVNDDRPAMGGLGSKSGIGSSTGGIGSAKGGIGSSTGGLGFSQAGIGSSNTTAAESATSFSSSSKGGISSSLPSSFANSRSTSSFVRDASPARTIASVPLSAAEQAHFNKLSNSFGARMLAKMGWQAGTGLGASGEGIVTPVESKMRPERSGIAFKGFKERTEQSKKEARRRGEEVSDDEDEKVKKAKKKAKEAKDKRADIWRKPKKVKVKVEHKSYEQIIAEAGEESVVASGIGQIIDATGAVPREVSSLADISLNTWTPSSDPTRIPEVRHNVRLIADACKTDLDGLAREAKALEERKKFVAQEDLRLRKKVEDEAELIDRLQKVQLVTTEIDTKAKELASVYEVSLDPLSPLFYNLTNEYPREFDRYNLDEIVVAAIAPLIRRMVSQWNPLEDPTAFISTFRTWRRALRVNTQEEQPPQSQVDVYGTVRATVAPIQLEKPMTPFESLLWNVWLPKVRTAINNDWDPRAASSAVKLYEAWSTFLPPFIRDNLLDQLILPKVQKAVAEWKPKTESVSLQAIVFPWLPYVGLRSEDVVGDARRKVKTLLRSWSAGDDVPQDLRAWKDVFDSSDWDAILLKYIVPKLGAILRTDFRINPRNQSMEPLQQVLSWSHLIRASIYSQLLETEFFPKWLDVLHIWLIQPKVSFEEVAQWYSFWKGTFSEDVQNLPGVSKGFTRGLQLMNKAIELGPDAPTKLARPDFRPNQDPPALSRNGAGKGKQSQRPSASRTHEITFRSLVEEFSAEHNLLFLPTGKAHEKSRMPLFRVSPSADGKGGLLVYILDDAVWASEQGVGSSTEDYRAISLDNMVLRAST